jgi:hypothetical protein
MVTGEPLLPVADLPPAGPSPGQKARRLLRPALWIAAIPIALVLVVPVLLVAVITKLFDRPVERTREEIAEILEARIAPDGDTPVWDEFICGAIADPDLDAIRRECLELEHHHTVPEPPWLDAEAIARVATLIAALRSPPVVEAEVVN